MRHNQQDHLLTGSEMMNHYFKHNIANDGSLCIDNTTIDDAGNYTCYMFGEPYSHQLSVIGKD